MNPFISLIKDRTDVITWIYDITTIIITAMYMCICMCVSKDVWNYFSLPKRMCGIIYLYIYDI